MNPFPSSMVMNESKDKKNYGLDPEKFSALMTGLFPKGNIQVDVNKELTKVESKPDFEPAQEKKSIFEIGEKKLSRKASRQQEKTEGKLNAMKIKELERKKKLEAERQKKKQEIFQKVKEETRQNVPNREELNRVIYGS